MPIYTCTVAESTLSVDIKRELAGEIARIHSSINHVPSTYVNVAFHELSADSLYTDGEAAKPVLVSGWVREGHQDRDHASCDRDRDGRHPDHCRTGGASACRHSKQPSAFRRGRRSCAARAGS